MTTFNAETSHVLFNRCGERLHCTVTLPCYSKELVPLVLILHGLKGFRNYSFLPLIAQQAASLNIIALRFCFSRNGMNGTSWIVQDQAAFANNTTSHEVDDVLDVVDAVRNMPELSDLRKRWNGTIHLVGHSRGGGVAIIASRELWHSLPDSKGTCVGLNTVGTWIKWTTRQRETILLQGFQEIQNQRTSQTLRMNLSYVEDIETNAERLSLERASHELGGSLTFVHAEQDLTVPVYEIESLISLSGSKSELVKIPNTTHTFGMTHPVERITSGFIRALEETFVRICK